MPEDNTHDNRPLESPLGLPDYVSLHEAAELLKVAPETFFEHTEKMPIHGRVLKLTLTKRPPVRDEVHRLRRELEALQKLEKSRPANEVLPILSNYHQAFSPRERLFPKALQRVLDAPQDWVLWDEDVDGSFRPRKTRWEEAAGGGSRPFEVLLLMRSELSVRGEDLRRALATAPRGEPQQNVDEGTPASNASAAQKLRHALTREEHLKAAFVFLWDHYQQQGKRFESKAKFIDALIVHLNASSPSMERSEKSWSGDVLPTLKQRKDYSE